MALGGKRQNLWKQRIFYIGLNVEETTQNEAQKAAESNTPNVREAIGTSEDSIKIAEIVQLSDRARVRVKREFVSVEEAELGFLKWFDTDFASIEARASKNAMALSLELNCALETITGLQKRMYAEWLNMSDEDKVLSLKPTKLILAAHLGVHPSQLTRWSLSREFAAVDVKAHIRAALLEHSGKFATNLNRIATTPMADAATMKLWLNVATDEQRGPAASVQVNTQNNVYTQPVDPTEQARIPSFKAALPPTDEDE